MIEILEGVINRLEPLVPANARLSRVQAVTVEDDKIMCTCGSGTLENSHELTQSAHCMLLESMIVEDEESSAFPTYVEARNSHLFAEGEDQNFFADIYSMTRELTNPSPCQQQSVCDTLARFQNLFKAKNTSAGQYEHTIKLKDRKTVVRRSYPVPIHLRKAVERELEEMLREGIIERSVSGYCNPLRIVKKKDVRLRICLDARFINQVIESDNESPPLIDELIQKYHGVRLMSTTDLANGYWQISLDKASRLYTAFLYGTSIYQFCRILFGLKTAGSGFIRALNYLFAREYDEFLTVYIDDLLITSKTFDEHMDHIRAVLTRLQDQKTR